MSFLLQQRESQASDLESRVKFLGHLIWAYYGHLGQEPTATQTGAVGYGQT